MFLCASVSVSVCVCAMSPKSNGAFEPAAYLYSARKCSVLQQTLSNDWWISAHWDRCFAVEVQTVWYKPLERKHPWSGLEWKQKRTEKKEEDKSKFNYRINKLLSVLHNFIDIHPKRMNLHLVYLFKHVFDLSDWYVAPAVFHWNRSSETTSESNWSVSPVTRWDNSS